MSHVQLVRGSGAAVTLGALVGRGGEGEVKDVVGHPTLVAKLYTQKPTRERIAKIAAMVAIADPDIAKIAAWPVDTLHDRAGGSVVGFLMPKVGDRLELHKLSHPMDRFQHFPDVGYDFLVHVATNVARAFQVLHEKGLVVGDVNESGVMVGRDGTVMLIDTDSMQFESGGTRYTCDVGKPEFQPPELLQQGTFRGVVRKVEHDAFGLSVLVFQLLFFGWHPFNVRMLIGDQEPLSDNILEHRFPYALGFRQRDFARPPHALDPGVFPDFVRDLFERAFVRGRTRPSAGDWVAGLMRFTGESRACPRFGTHAFHASLPSCPLCDLDARLGFPILPHIALDAATLRKLWSTVQSAYYELSAPMPEEVDLGDEPIDVKPVPAEVMAHARKTVRLTWGQVAIGLVSLGLVVVSPWALTGLLGCVAIEVVVRATRPPATREALDDHRRIALELTRARAASSAPNDAAVIQNHEVAADAYQRIVHHDDFVQKAVADLYDRAFPTQIRRFLAEVRLQPGVIPGIDKKRVAALNQAGIRTAADVTEDLPALPGFTAQHYAILHRWVEFNQSQFMPDMRDPALLAQLAATKTRLDAEQARHVESLKLSSEWLVERIPTERERRQRVLQRYRAAAREQAEHDAVSRVARARLRWPRG